MFTATNSTKSPTSCSTCTPNTSTLPPCLNVFAMSVSTDSPAPFSKVSESPTGLLQRSSTAGNSTPTPDRPGKTLWMTFTLNGLQCNSPANAKNPTFSSGSVSNNSAKETPQDCSTTKYHSQLDGDTVATCSASQTMRRNAIAFCGPSLTLTKTER